MSESSKEIGAKFFISPSTVKREIRHIFDKLGVNDAVLRVDTVWSQKRLVGREQFLPLLDRVAKNETFVNLARDRAARLAAVLRAAGKAAVE